MLNIIVIIHEAGHFVAARSFGVHCHEFSIGMGPAIYQRQGKQTLFSIRALPIGGYVMMAGEEDGSQDEEDEDSWLKNVPENERLNNKPKWQQVIIMLAGVFMNFVLAILLMASVIGIQGRVAEDPIPQIAEVSENSPAEKAGLQPGDTLVQAEAEDGTVSRLETMRDLQEFVALHPGNTEFLVDRNGETFSVNIEPQLNEETQTYLIGITVATPVREVGFLEAIPLAVKEMWDSTVMIFASLGQLFQGRQLDQLSGPVGIYKVTDQVVSMGFLPYLSLCALLSLNIGIFNLLPVPALDGGRVLILILEGIFRRKIPAKVVETVILASFVLLFGLMIFATWNDLVRFFL